ncbi:Myb-like_DNA-binding domain-containing protein [Hexamita inflata]|uniref:Myb-like DNA-binding domain-containing protein n=1 Tax=Hexamita inflata TaxID=28002 RepID=A0AA86P371_9EUKA|nr:Myb-like DNA-binding domain-containing protein [Hexamita inflata]
MQSMCINISDDDLGFGAISPLLQFNIKSCVIQTKNVHEAPQAYDIERPVRPTPAYTNSAANKQYRYDYEYEVATRKASVPWSMEEDLALTQLVRDHEQRNWSEVARQLGHAFPNRMQRSCNQCNQRWMRVLCPGIKKGKWTADEDQLLQTVMLNCEPKKWKQIALQIPGRTDIQIRYRVLKIRDFLLQAGVPEEYIQ